MDQEHFQVADHGVDQIAELLDPILQSPAFGEVRAALARLGKALGERYAVTLSCLVEVTDHEKERSLPLLTTGLCTSKGEEPHMVSGDSTPQRYLVDGQIQVLPHDRCPKCWGPWDFKFQNRQCRSCGAELGREVRVLVDSDVCPYCEEGKVTVQRPRCTQCGFEVDGSLVAWG